jgi:hypothetical protein
MSTQEPSLSIETPAAAGAIPHASAESPPFWRRVGSKVEWAGEWLNPLLVKEVRQSLKSRQFSITFTAVLCLSWLWSIAGIARLGPEVAYGANGPEMFFGYYLILALPLILLVPYSAYRSLIAEREDNTYELVAITTLRPRQIVAGKLGSAVAQMAVYFSAVAPCLAFTYLLRGIDVPTIFWIMFYTFLASLGFSLCALLLATIAKEKHWQVMLAVLMVVVLFYAFMGASEICRNLLRYSRLPFSSSDFWLQNLIFLSFYGSTFALLYSAAAAQLTFTAENRSTPLRCAMLVQQILWVGWMGFALFRTLAENHNLGATVGPGCTLAMTVSVFYWFGMGSFMIGEATELSPRVKRRLPVSSLGRAFLTWFNPGPGTGYLFVLSNVIVMTILALVAVWYGEASGGGRIGGLPAASVQIATIFLQLGYFTIYLGTANLLLRLLRKFTHVNLAAAVAVSVLLVLAGWGIPAIIDPYYIGSSNYNLGHVTDPFWTCVGTFDSRISVGSDELLIIILPTAAAVFLFNLVYIVPEIRQQRITPPPRVVEEDRTRTAELQPKQPQPTNPWD